MQRIYDRIDEMAPHVPGDSCPEVPPTAPMEGVIGTLTQGEPEPSRSIDPSERSPGRSSRLRPFQPLLPIGPRSVGPGVYLADFPDDTVLQGVNRRLNPFGDGVECPLSSLQSWPCSDLREAACFVDGMSERFLCIAV